MVTATTVICWIFGIGGLFCFGASMNMPQLYAGQYMILSLMFVLAAIYFNMKFKEINRRKLLDLTEQRLNNLSGFEPKPKE